MMSRSILVEEAGTGRILAWIDNSFSVEAWSRFSEDDRVRARVIFSVLVFAAVSVGISAFVMMCLSLLMVRNLWIGVIFSAVISLLMGLSALDFRKRGHIGIAANSFAMLMFVSIGSAFVFTGGITSPVAFLLLAVPVAIFMAAGRKSGLLWSVITVLFFLSICILQGAGVEFIQIMRSENREVVTTSLWYLSGFIIIGFLGIYERVVSGLAQAIEGEKTRYRNQALYDPATGFYNRDTFQKKFEDCLHATTQSGGRLALIRADVLNLKAVLAQLGYDVGDEMVKKISQGFRTAIREEGVVGRFASGEFCILLPHVRDRGQVISLVSRLKKTIGTHIRLDSGLSVPVHLCIGGVFAPDFSISPRSLMRGVQDAVHESEAFNEHFVLR